MALNTNPKSSGFFRKEGGKVGLYLLLNNERIFAQKFVFCSFFAGGGVAVSYNSTVMRYTLPFVKAPSPSLYSPEIANRTNFLLSLEN